MAKPMTSRIDEIRARVAQTAWQNRTQADRDAEYLLVLIAEAEDRFNRINQRECEGSNRPGVYECNTDPRTPSRPPCLGCALRVAEQERDHNAQGWRDAQELLQSVTQPCRRCSLSQCPPGCCCPCHRDVPHASHPPPEPLDPDVTYQPLPHQYQVRDPSYPPPPPPPRNHR